MKYFPGEALKCKALQTHINDSTKKLKNHLTYCNIYDNIRVQKHETSQQSTAP